MTISRAARVFSKRHAAERRARDKPRRAALKAGRTQSQGSIPVKKIISGGQTGVDRAALDVALAHSIACGGWCPAGRRAEDGVIARRYPLRETVSADYRERTYHNVQEADGTLILARGSLIGGSALTRQFAHTLNKSCLVVDLAQNPAPQSVHHWLRTNRIRILNVAGPRESQRPGIYQQAKRFLRRLLLETRP